jgi:hypothetical protein
MIPATQEEHDRLAALQRRLWLARETGIAGSAESDLTFLLDLLNRAVRLLQLQSNEEARTGSAK